MVAGFVKGVIGLGLPTVAMGLLAVIMTPAQAAALLVAPSLLTNVWQAMGPELAPLTRRLWLHDRIIATIALVHENGRATLQCIKNAALRVSVPASGA